MMTSPNYFHSQTCQTKKTKSMCVPAFNLRSEKSGAAGNGDLWWTVMIWPLDPSENCLPNVKQRMFRDGNWSGQPVITEFTAEAVKLCAFISVIFTQIYYEHAHTYSYSWKKERFPSNGAVSFEMREERRKRRINLRICIIECTHKQKWNEYMCVCMYLYVLVVYQTS